MKNLLYILGVSVFPKYIENLITHTNMCTYIYTQGISRLVDITAGGDFLGLCDQKSSHKHVSDFGQLRSCRHFLIPVHTLV